MNTESNPKAVRRPCAIARPSQATGKAKAL
jgi:hypothetical protein